MTDYALSPGGSSASNIVTNATAAALSAYLGDAMASSGMPAQLIRDDYTFPLITKDQVTIQAHWPGTLQLACFTPEPVQLGRLVWHLGPPRLSSVHTQQVKVDGYMQVNITKVLLPANFTADNSINGDAVYAANTFIRVMLYSDSPALALQHSKRRRLMADPDLAGAQHLLPAQPMHHGNRGRVTQSSLHQPDQASLRRSLLASGNMYYQDFLQTKLELTAAAFPIIVQCNRSAMMDNFFGGAWLPDGLQSNCSSSLTEADTSPYALDSYLKGVRAGFPLPMVAAIFQRQPCSQWLTRCCRPA